MYRDNIFPEVYVMQNPIQKSSYFRHVDAEKKKSIVRQLKEKMYSFAQFVSESLDSSHPTPGTRLSLISW